MFCRKQTNAQQQNKAKQTNEQTNKVLKTHHQSLSQLRQIIIISSRINRFGTFLEAYNFVLITMANSTSCVTPRGATSRSRSLQCITWNMIYGTAAFVTKALTGNLYETMFLSPNVIFAILLWIAESCCDSGGARCWNMDPKRISN